MATILRKRDKTDRTKMALVIISGQGASGKFKHELIRTDVQRSKHKDGQFNLSNFLVHLLTVTRGE